MEPEDDLHFENELKKIQLELEYGMTFGKTEGGEGAPPEVMRDFLDHVAAFEQSCMDATPVKVSVSMGAPAWRKEAEIPDAEISAELENVVAFLAQHHTVVDVIYTVEDRELYRFITEELMEHESNGMNFPGMTAHYIYEEFHPNAEMDIRERCADFFKRYLDKTKTEYFDYDMTSEYQKDPTPRNFRDAFDHFKNRRFKLTKLTIDGERAYVEYKGSFTAYVGGEGLKFGGKGTMELDGTYDCWQISKVEWPERI